MSIQAMNIVWEKSRAKNGDLVVMLALADFANASFWAWPSIDKLAKKCRVSRRSVTRIIDRCVALGELLVEENSGINGVNKYLILLATKGVIPKSSTPDKVSPLTNGHSENGEAALAHKPLLSDLTHTQPVEWPSSEDVRKFASEYPGNMAKGIPAIIPEAWADNYFAWRTFTARSWPADWKKEFVFRFERNWQDGEKRARGSLQTATGQNKKTGGRKREEILHELSMEKNPARRAELEKELAAL